jgi:hypothetical protein
MAAFQQEHFYAMLSGGVYQSIKDKFSAVFGKRFGRVFLYDIWVNIEIASYT